jgi:pimeloyl-ACP methyl ester carboxylesterase
VEYTPNKKIVRHPDNVKERVARANNIILLVHGIIGDTRVMAQGLKLAVDENNNNIADLYDLVLTYDYENLNTPIHESALQLKKALKEVGIHEQQQKKITILSHSMGGLLSRWLVEQEGGKQFVKHLVMAGTPNNGSVFGNIGDYKNMAITTLTLSLNFIKPLVTHAGALLFVLNQSDKLFTSLNQMKEDSTFIRHLDLTGDPHVKYTILAGDITHYRVDKQGYFSALIEKIKTSVGKLAYGNLPNDIAVSVASIKKVEEKRQPPPEKIDLVCHHLNYFSAETSLNALQMALVPGE